MKNNRSHRTKLDDRIDEADRKQKGKEKGANKKHERSSQPSGTVHAIGDLTSQYGAVENELERVGKGPKRH